MTATCYLGSFRPSDKKALNRVSRAHTLMELLSVIANIASLAAISLPLFAQVSEAAILPQQRLDQTELSS